MKLNFAFISLFASAMLFGCGGGGGGGGGEPSPPPVDVTYQLWNAFVNSAKEAVSREFTASGTVNGLAVTASGSVAGQPMRAGTFEGHPALIKDTATAGTVTINGQTLPLIGLTSAFFDPGYLPLGMASDGEYDVVTGTPTFPQVAKLNDAGALFTYARYADSSKTASLGTGSASYALLQGSDTSALLKVTVVERRQDGSVESTSTRTYSLQPEGVMVPLSEEYSAGADVMNTQYGRVL